MIIFESLFRIVIFLPFAILYFSDKVVDLYQFREAIFEYFIVVLGRLMNSLNVLLVKCEQFVPKFILAAVKGQFLLLVHEISCALNVYSFRVLEFTHF
jgi:hypothetical protein